MPGLAAPAHRNPLGNLRESLAFPLGLLLGLPAHARPVTHDTTGGAPCCDAGADVVPTLEPVSSRSAGTGLSVRDRQPHGMAARASLGCEHCLGVEVVGKHGETRKD
jgi:hypothetical protein